MVKINSWTKNDGTTANTINLSGCGDEEEILLTIKSSEIYIKEHPAGVSKEGKAYEAFETYGMSADYHKNGETFNVWVNLTGSQKYKLVKLGLEKGKKVIAYKGKKGIDFKVVEEAGDKTPVTTTLLNINTTKSTNFERELIETCKKHSLNIEEIQLQFKGHKEQGSDIIDYDIERIKKLI